MNDIIVKKPFYKKPLPYILLATIVLVVLLLVPVGQRGANKQVKVKDNSTSASSTQGAKSNLPVNAVNKSSNIQAVLVSSYVLKTETLNLKEKGIGFVYNPSINNITVESSGFLENLTVDVGSKISVGQKIGNIVNQDLKNNKDSLLADINKLQNQIDQQQKLVSRYKDLLAGGHIATVEFENAELQLKTLQSQMINLKSSLKNLEIQISKLNIVSKVSGIVQQKNFSNKDFVNIGSSILQVVNNANLMLSVAFPENYAGLIKSGQTVSIKTKEGKTLSSKVLEIKPLLDETTRSLVAIVKIPEKHDNLNPGSTVDVEIFTKAINNAILVPEMSVVLRPAGSVVYIVSKARTDLGKDYYEVEQRVVELGERVDGVIQILSGVKVGDVVVVEGAGFLSNKALIRLSK